LNSPQILEVAQTSRSRALKWAPRQDSPFIIDAV
jgi:hypothetical protein